jgi:hypothetical protein
VVVGSIGSRVIETSGLGETEAGTETETEDMFAFGGCWWLKLSKDCCLGCLSWQRVL